jgi:hypothetical protein
MRIHPPGQFEEAQDVLCSEMFDAQQGAASRLVHGMQGQPDFRF